jgi:hypothetical protein
MRHLKSLEQRTTHFADPVARIRLSAQRLPRLVQVDLRVALGPREADLISHQSAETPDHAVRLAVQDIERQLERKISQLRGEESWGVPSRRLPKSTRPHPNGGESVPNVP